MPLSRCAEGASHWSRTTAAPTSTKGEANSAAVVAQWQEEPGGVMRSQPPAWQGQSEAGADGQGQGVAALA